MNKLTNELIRKLPNLSDNDIITIKHYMEAARRSGYSEGLEIKRVRVTETNQ